MMAIAGIMLASVLTCLGQLCQKQATRPPGRRSRRRHISLWLGLAVLLMVLALLLWLLVLQSVPIGVAYPMLSLNFVWITLAARWIWHEPVTLRHWCGVALIVVGIALLGGAA
ncbi:4-amino-4-deoxy-L-arabinose-phosphoundecaprenol flippase subunit ArnE [Entomohabitans teleogrylli]|uniref:4-amino-4-deoxy-L-arabinose-phosphoundecaprenol flippase subunit ArnE n=1 Tax=Entomohabitans teleogrylli TaxID=1384589 RepID=UPI00073D7A13|nr:4-amino-4-deoxy-L-arabinose-phosphoundecaprenol flippase subunit ArnE [Entomohabitans teleogrylli]